MTRPHAVASALRRGLFALVLVGAALSAQAQQKPGASGSPHGDLAIECSVCHSAEGWTPVRETKFDHSTTGFRLESSHSRVACRSCHQKLVFSAVGVACADCHQDPHRGEMGHLCENCHRVDSWSNQREMFQKHARSRFPLLAIHAALDCQACHRSSQPYEYGSTPNDCGTCHASTVAETRNPDHVKGNFSRRCEDCHSVTGFGWKGARFDDHSKTRFPLTGAHTSVDCARCHVGSRYTGTSTQCFSCHETQYRSTTNPNHVAGGYSTRCDGCHTTTGWRPATFLDHNSTRFPLTGAHNGVDCAGCHVGGRYTGTSTTCVSCHEAQYRGTTNPNHVAGGFPTTCEGCHSTSAWRPAASIDHSRTRFPLTGAHNGVDCARCHVGGRFTGTPTDCYSCHETQYRGTTNPNHSGGGFPTTCEACHSTSAWRPADFNHSNTRFPLTGAHRSTDCARCHVGGRYAGTPTDCNSCHSSDYNQTGNPNHSAAGFPRECETCHTTSAWRPASFDHDGRYFPINSGRHRGVWSSCSDCHVNSGNYRQFECINCHEHEKAETDRNHRDVRNYSYVSSECYRCHPRGNAE